VAAYDVVQVVAGVQLACGRILGQQGGRRPGDQVAAGK
jgi:hypothetical protein